MSESVQITAKPNIVGGESYNCMVEPGKTITELFPDLTEQAQIEINGEVLPREEFDCYRLAESDIVLVRVFPQGGGEQSKNVARQVALLAVVAASAWVSYGASGLLASGQTFGTALLGAATHAAGSALVSPLKLKRTGL